jgi:hypothetical protein
MAESMCRVSDDLAYDFPQRDDRPAIQNWDTTNVSGNAVPLARKWTGDYSWIVSIAPTTNAARDGMARSSEGFAYDVSVVVFYKRPLPTTAPQTITDLPNAVLHERSVSAAVISSGLNGGELLLTNIGDIANNNPFDQLKTGQWIMLCGPHPNSTDGGGDPAQAEPRFVLKWYQVLSIDKTGAGVMNFDAARQRVVAVRGPEWPWQPAANPTYTVLQANAHLSNDLCVGICRGAVAVHTRTIRLESPLGGGAFGAGTSVITPPGVTPGAWTR